jgi:serine/threonine-protein kinase RsbW
MNYRYKIGCSLNNLKSIRDFIRTSLKGHGISDVVMNEIVLALDEMCSNLMIHSHHCNPEHQLELHIRIPQKGDLVFEIIDESNLFDITKFEEPDLGNLIHEKRKGGLGVRLVKKIMDSIEYLSKDGKNVCRLKKKIG